MTSAASRSDRPYLADCSVSRSSTCAPPGTNQLVCCATSPGVHHTLASYRLSDHLAGRAFCRAPTVLSAAEHRVCSLLLAEDPPFEQNWDRFNRTTLNFGFIIAQNTSLTMRTLKVWESFPAHCVPLELHLSDQNIRISLLSCVHQRRCSADVMLPSQSPVAHLTTVLDGC